MLKRVGSIAAVGVLLASCGTLQLPSRSGGGSGDDVSQPMRQAVAINSCSNLVRIRADNTAAGVAAQSAWLEKYYPGAEKTRQTVSECGQRPVDKIAFTHNGVDHIVLFDISSYFGKVDGDDLDDLLDG